MNIVYVHIKRALNVKKIISLNIMFQFFFSLLQIAQVHLQYFLMSFLHIAGHVKNVNFTSSVP